MGNAIGFGAIAVTAQSLNRDHLERRPGKGSVPLVAALVGAGLETTGALEHRKIAHDSSSLLFACDASPQRVERREKRVRTAADVYALVVEVKSGMLVPH